MKNKHFDPVAYIEDAFLDKPKKTIKKLDITDGSDVPTVSEFLRNGSGLVEVEDRYIRKQKFKKTAMSAPRPRRAKDQPAEPEIDPELQALWENLPKTIEFLSGYYDDSVTSNYYGKGFRESRNDLIRRILDPELNLEETARLLGVCPATVRRYTNRGWLNHHRTAGGQRRFRLGDILKFVEAHGRFPEE
jgi:excisionase family DNA binding protein